MELGQNHLELRSTALLGSWELHVAEDGIRVRSGKFSGPVRYEDVTGVGYQHVKNSNVILPLPVKIPAGASGTLRLSFRGADREVMLAQTTTVRHTSSEIASMFDAYRMIAIKTIPHRAQAAMTEFSERGYFTHDGARFKRDMTVEKNGITLSIAKVGVLNDQGTLYMAESRRPMMPFIKKIKIDGIMNGDLLRFLCQKVYGLELP